MQTSEGHCVFNHHNIIDSATRCCKRKIRSATEVREQTEHIAVSHTHKLGSLCMYKIVYIYAHIHVIEYSLHLYMQRIILIHNIYIYNYIIRVWTHTMHEYIKNVSPIRNRPSPNIAHIVKNIMISTNGR